MEKRFNVRGMIDNARREKKIGKLLSTLKVMDEAQAAQWDLAPIFPMNVFKAIVRC